MIEHMHALPTIVQDNILSADLNNFFEEAVDPTHREELRKLGRVNKLLAHFVLKQAYEYSASADEQNKILASLMRTIDLINIAEYRERSLQPSTTDDVDDEFPPHLSAPDDDPPAQ